MLLVMEHGNQSLSDRFPLVAVVEMSVGLLMLGALVAACWLVGDETLRSRRRSGGTATIGATINSARHPSARSLSQRKRTAAGLTAPEDRQGCLR